MSGYVRISRDILDDCAFADEAYTEREAFLWLIFRASFKAREDRVGSVTVNLERGQLAASSRFMAKAWGWSEARVRRYFERLKNRRMIECVADAGVTVITVCKYDKYQADERVGDAGATQQPTQDRRTADAKKKEDGIREEIEANASIKRESARDVLSPILGDDLAAAFIAHRKALKAPMTEHAARLMAKKLAAMADPGAAAEQSITRGWRDVFPVAEVHPFPSKGQTRGERYRALSAELDARLAAKPFD